MLKSSLFGTARATAQGVGGLLDFFSFFKFLRNFALVLGLCFAMTMPLKYICKQRYIKLFHVGNIILEYKLVPTRTTALVHGTAAAWQLRSILVVTLFGKNASTSAAVCSRERRGESSGGDARE